MFILPDHEHSEHNMHDIKAELRPFIRYAGLAGFASVILILASATIRLPGTPANVSTSITPFAEFELVHTKAQLEAILGPAGSEARKIIAGRKSGPGFDFTFSIAIFMLALCQLQRRLRPDQHFFTLSAMVMLAAALGLDYFFIHRAAAIANEAGITENAALTLRTVGWIKWSLVLFSLTGCTGFLTMTPPLLRFGAMIMRGAAFLGVVAVAFNQHYMGLAVLGMFIGLCGVSALFVFNPELALEHDSTSEEANDAFNS
jgi:hypothetical protein